MGVGEAWNGIGVGTSMGVAGDERGGGLIYTAKNLCCARKITL